MRKIKAADLRGFEAAVHPAELSNSPLCEIFLELIFEVKHRGSVHLAWAL